MAGLKGLLEGSMKIGRRDSAMEHGPTGTGEEGWKCLESQISWIRL